MERLAEAIGFYLVFLFSVTLHEAAHAWSALRGGDPTAYHGGQVSLLPLPHVRREPFGMLVLPLITVFLSGWPIGFASAPYDPEWARRHPRRAAWMALAGPISNLALALTAGLLVHAGMVAGLLAQPDSVSFRHVVDPVDPGFASGAAFLLSAAFSLNLVLFLLNVIPVPPLDGSGAIQLLMTPAQAEGWQRLLRQPALGWLGILVAWRLLDAVFLPCFLFAISLLYPGSRYG